MSNIPIAREQLQGIAKRLQIGAITKPQAAREIRSTMRLLVRQSPVRRAPRVSRYVTRRLIGEIKAFARVHPLMTLQDIAEHFGVNIGRVSEILNGKR
jgi:hypothetical protein